MKLEHNALVLALSAAALASAPAFADKAKNPTANNPAFDTPSEVAGQPADLPTPKDEKATPAKKKVAPVAFDNPGQVAGQPVGAPRKVDAMKPKGPPDINPAAFDTPGEVVGKKP